MVRIKNMSQSAIDMLDAAYDSNWAQWYEEIEKDIYEAELSFCFELIADVFGVVIRPSDETSFGLEYKNVPPVQLDHDLYGEITII